MNLAALNHPGFRLYFIGAVASANALWIFRILLTWLAWDLSGSASFVGLIAALTLAPTIVSGPLFGVLVDRINIRFAAALAGSSMLLTIAMVSLLYYAGLLNIPVLAVMAGLGGVSSSLHHPVRMSLAPRLVEPQIVSSVVALIAVNFNTARLISPAIAGIIIERLGIQPGLLIAFCLFCPAILLLPFLRPRGLAERASKGSFFEDLKDGFVWIKQHPHPQQILLLSALFAVAVRAPSELLPVIADGLYQMGATGLGQLGSAVGIGALASAMIKALAAARQDGRLLSASDSLIALLGIIAAAGLGVHLIWGWALVMAARVGFAATYLGVSMQASMQQQLPDQMRGRVMSLFVVIAMGATAIGAFVLGWLAEVFSVTSAHAGFSLVAVLGLGLLLIYQQRARR